MSKPLLVCRNKEGKIQHIDVDMCHKSFFGTWKPDFKCGNKNNTHTCEEFNELTIAFLKTIDEKTNHLS